MGNIVTEHGYVVYHREADPKSLWYQVWLKKKEALKNSFQNLSNPDLNRYKEIGNSLINMGNTERAKENALLQQVLGKDYSDSDKITFISEFNSVLVGVDRYKQALKNIKTALNIEHNTLAPSISSLFAGTLVKHFGQALNGWLRQNASAMQSAQGLGLTDSQLTQIFSTLLSQAADNAMNELLSGKGKNDGNNYFGSYVKYLQEAGILLQQQPYDIFHTILQNKINVDNLVNWFKNSEQMIIQRFAQGKRLSGRAWADKALNITTRAGQLGGSINEVLNMVWQQANFDTVITNKGIARTNIGEKQLTDNTVIINTSDVQINLQAIIDDLETHFKAGNTLNEVATQMEDFFNTTAKQLNDSFIIFQSGKAYGKTDYFTKQGFTNGGQRKVTDLADILPKSANMSKENADNFIDVVLSTMKGAILDGDKAIIEDNLRAYIAESMAYLLFDDWINLGESNQTGAKALHAFILDDIYVPLSVLLISAGNAALKAVDNIKQYFSVTINDFGEIKYPRIEDYPMITSSSGEEYYDVAEAWQLQRQEAAQKATFQTHFFKSFFDEIQIIIKALGI